MTTPTNPTDGTTRIHMRTFKVDYSARMQQGIYAVMPSIGTAVIYLDGLRVGRMRVGGR
jgi:hypothetical protein